MLFSTKRVSAKATGFHDPLGWLLIYHRVNLAFPNENPAIGKHLPILFLSLILAARGNEPALVKVGSSTKNGYAVKILLAIGY